jgi:hypothetical protein
MPVQEYKINIRKSVVGALYGMSYTNSERQSGKVLDVDGAGFGLAVKAGAEDRTVEIGVEDTGIVYGVSIRAVNMEQTTYPGTGEIKYKKGAQMAFVREGTIQVRVNSGASVVQGEVFVDEVTGEFHTVTGAGRIKAINARWTSKTASGDIGRLTITVANQIVAAP